MHCILKGCFLCSLNNITLYICRVHDPQTCKEKQVIAERASSYTTVPTILNPTSCSKFWTSWSSSSFRAYKTQKRTSHPQIHTDWQNMFKLFATQSMSIIHLLKWQPPSRKSPYKDKLHKIQADTVKSFLKKKVLLQSAWLLFKNKHKSELAVLNAETTAYLILTLNLRVQNHMQNYKKRSMQLL